MYVNIKLKFQCKKKTKESIFIWKHCISLWSTKFQPISSVKNQSDLPSMLKSKKKKKKIATHSKVGFITCRQCDYNEDFSTKRPKRRIEMECCYLYTAEG